MAFRIGRPLGGGAFGRICHAVWSGYLHGAFRHMKKKIPVNQRFWSKVRISSDGDACWDWAASTHRDGYGFFRPDGAKPMVLAHRYCWVISFGSIPAGLSVLHRCDNPKCVNPAHLFLGTQRDNMRDMTAKGRRVGRGGSRGIANPCAKLDDEKVRQIRAIYAQGGVTIRVLAARYGIADGQIGAIIAKKAWKHV